MPVQIEIQDNDLAGFTPEGKNILKSEIEKYSKEVIQESGRIEATVMRMNNSASEITGYIVEKAASVCRDPFKRKKSKKMIGLQIASMLLMFTSGIIFNVENFKQNTLLMACFILSTILGLTAGIIIIVSGGDN